MTNNLHPKKGETIVNPFWLKPQTFILITIVIASFTLIGWLTNLRFLSGQWGIYIPTAPLAALIFLFQGFTLLLCLLYPGKILNRNLALSSIIISSIICFLILIESIFGIKVRIEQLLSFTSITLNQIPIGRMSPLTAVSFLLINSAILILITIQRNNQTTTSVAMLAVISVFINFIVIIGYIFGTPLLYGGKIIPTALLTAIAIFSESIGLFQMSASHSLWLLSWNMHSFKGRLLRAFLIPIVGIIFLESWLESRIEIRQPGNLLLFHAIVVLVFIIFAVIVIGLIAKRMGDSLEQAEKIIKQQNDKLHDLNTSKDKFFSIIAHDLKSPFLGFLGLTNELAHNAAQFTLPEMTELGVTLHQSSKNLFNLLHNLLEWTQIQNGSISLEQNNISLDEIIKHNIQMIMPACEQKGILINNLVTHPIRVFADKKMLDSILLNLLSNAVKFTHRNGTITVGTNATNNGRIEISISDTGIGLSKHLIDNLFIIGEKTGRKGTEGELSTGLGLMLCKEFVEKNGGIIRVESKEGLGSTFYFTLQSKFPGSQF
jgi:signal transduction histidine kinase